MKLKENIWAAAKIVLLVVLAGIATRPAEGVSPSAAPVFLHLFIVAFSFGLYVVVTPLILRLFPSTKDLIAGSLWRVNPIRPLSFAHFLAWLAFAFSAGQIIQCFSTQCVTDDLLIPISASIGSGLGILAGIARLRGRYQKANPTSEGIRQPADGSPKPSM